jgi:hypothetical protein
MSMVKKAEQRIATYCPLLHLSLFALPLHFCGEQH